MAGAGGNDADQHHPKSYKFCKTDFFVTIVIVSALVLFAGLMSGLTLGLMSISLVDLEVLAKSGTPRDRIYALIRFTEFDGPIYLRPVQDLANCALI